MTTMFEATRNVGRERAIEAARLVGAKVAFPQFGRDRPDGATDFNDLHQASGLDSVRACVESATVVPSARAQLLVTWLRDAAIGQVASYWIKGLIAAAALVLVFGPPGCGKTFWVLDVAARIATRLQWRGQRVSQGLVVIVAVEAGSSVVVRGVAWRQRYLPEERAGESIPLAFLNTPLDLRDRASQDRLLALLEELTAQAELPLALVVIDTLSRAAPGANENAPDDMSAIIGGCDRIRSDTGATVLLVHHSGKDAGKGARGHSILNAAADTIISIDDRTATIEKSRDGASGARFPFDLDIVEMGQDADGDPITTCVVRQLDEAAARPAKPREPSGVIQRLLLRTLRTLVHERGEARAIGRAVPVELLVEHAATKLPGKKEPWRARQHLIQSLTALQAHGFANVADEWVSTAEASSVRGPSRKY